MREKRVMKLIETERGITKKGVRVSELRIFEDHLTSLAFIDNSTLETKANRSVQLSLCICMFGI